MQLRSLFPHNFLTTGQIRYAITGSLFFLLLSVFFVECIEVLPACLEYQSTLYYCVLLFAIFALFNVLYNLVCLVFADPSISKLMLIQRASPDWSYCLRCESIRPPRAHHCLQCDICILRYDHHCTLLGRSALSL